MASRPAGSAWMRAAEPLLLIMETELIAPGSVDTAITLAPMPALIRESVFEIEIRVLGEI